jgi:hypothetical protein
MGPMPTVTPTELEWQFAELFQGNWNAHGTDAGGCVREPPNFAAHLSSTPIGIYPIASSRPEVVHWGAIDFDIKGDNHPSCDYETEAEAHEAAVNLQAVLAELGVTAWIERTRSHGRHIWVFASQWVPASTMRRALLVASEIAGTPTREVNPKQETLPKGKLGNYVRVPYPAGDRAVDRTEQVIIRPDRIEIDGRPYRSYLTLSHFVTTGLAARTSPSTLQTIADMWRPQSKVPLRTRQSWQAAVDMMTGTKLNAKGIHLWENGPNDGDRSRGMSYLARQCYESGLDRDVALMVLGSCEWNKFTGRSDEAKRLEELVNGAYG